MRARSWASATYRTAALSTVAHPRSTSTAAVTLFVRLARRLGGPSHRTTPPINCKLKYSRRVSTSLSNPHGHQGHADDITKPTTLPRPQPSTVKMAPQGDDTIFQPKDAIKSGVSGALFSGGAGLLIASLRTSMKKNNVGSMHVFTHGGGTIISFAFAGGVYRFAQQASANLREKDDALNHAIGAFLGGSVMGLRSLRFPVILGFGAMAGAVVGTFAFTGGKLSGYGRDPNVDEYERKEAMRLNRRRPVEETLAEVGEGRGIYPPGYQERRRQRLLEKYGVEVKPVSADPNVASA